MLPELLKVIIRLNETRTKHTLYDISLFGDLREFFLDQLSELALCSAHRSRHLGRHI